MSPCAVAVVSKVRLRKIVNNVRLLNLPMNEETTGNTGSTGWGKER